MTSQTLISLAILKTNSDTGLDVYDNFVPLLAECVRNNGEEIISVPTIKKEMINKFGICIPQHVIDTILIRLRNKGLIEIKVKESIVKPTKKVLVDDIFQKVRLDALRKHEVVLQELVDFCKSKFSIEWTIGDAEEALLSFIEEFQLNLLHNSAQGKVIPFDVSTTITGRFLVGSFVKHLLDTYSSSIEYLDTITKGFMLANAMYLPNPSLAKRKFNKTKIFFDTTFLIHALGYAGITRQNPCKELIDMLYETGAELKCFRHTLEEIRGVLDSASTLISQNRVRDASKVAIPNLEFFISINASPSDIKHYIVKLEKNLENLRIRVVDTPDYINHDHVIDEEEFGNLLAEKIHYRNADGNAKARDVQSISSIIRIRRGLCYEYVEDSQAVFVTNNSRLARESTNYLQNKCQMTGISACITDHMLTNMLWLKAPLKTPDLPRKVILADCFAATQPSPDLWRVYLREITRLSHEEEISTDDYYMLRYELTAKTVLMEKTLGEEGAFTQGTVREIMEVVKTHYTAGISLELNKTKEEINVRDKLDVKRRENIRGRAIQIGKTVCKAINVLVFIILLICNLISAYFAYISGGLGYIALGITIILVIYTIIDIWKNIFLEIKLRALEIRISAFVEKKFLKLAGFEGSEYDILGGNNG